MPDASFLHWPFFAEHHRRFAAGLRDFAAAEVHGLVDHLGLALANLVNLYNPQQVVVAGWFGDRIAGEFLGDLRAAVRRYSLPQPGAEVVVERSTLGPEIAALGAATLPLDRFIEHGWSL